MPPSREEIQTEGELSPNYIPPGVQNVQEQLPEIRYYNEVTEADYRGNNQDQIIRADLPLYNPPKPGEKIAQAPKIQTKTEAPKKSIQKAEPKKPSATIPAARIIKQSDKKEKEETAPVK